jgi:predicted RNA-binding Zn ribbon-like protein
MAGGAAASQVPVGQAPGDLATVQAFVNTLDIELATDELSSPAGLSGWLAAAGLSAAGTRPASKSDLALALRLREALRGVLRLHARHGRAGDTRDRAAEPAASLSEIAASLPVRLDADRDGRVRPVPAGSGTGAALARILLISADAATEGTWTRLKACSADDCQWAFYDRSPTRNGCWCSMQICGSRAKSRAYRRRTAHAQAAPADLAFGARASRSGRTAGPGA